MTKRDNKFRRVNFELKRADYYAIKRIAIAEKHPSVPAYIKNLIVRHVDLTK